MQGNWRAGFLLINRINHCHDSKHFICTAENDATSSGGSSLATTPTLAGSSYNSPGPIDGANPLQQQQQLFLQMQALGQRVVQQHSAPMHSSTSGLPQHPHAIQANRAVASVGGSLELTSAVELEKLRSHSQLLLAQQRAQQMMQQMVHKKESVDSTLSTSVSSSWDGIGGLKGFMANLAGESSGCVVHHNVLTADVGADCQNTASQCLHYVCSAWQIRAVAS